MDFYTGDYANFNEIDSVPQFMIAINSDSKFEKQHNSIFDGNSILKEDSAYISNSKIDHIYNSKSYKLGHYILWPLKLLKRIKYFK